LEECLQKVISHLKLQSNNSWGVLVFLWS
jgi:hypothetical protein